MLFASVFFSSINQSYGHDAGDNFLRLFSNKLTGSMRSYDIIGRYADYEFMLIMPELSKHQAVIPLNQIIATLDETDFDAEAESLKLDVSIGVVECPVDGGDADELITSMEASLLESKSSGKNRVAIFIKV